MLAAVALFSGTNSIIDRLANALSHEVVSKVMHEASRILDTVIVRQEQNVGIMEINKNGQPYLQIRVNADSKAQPYEVYGKLPSDRLVSEFLEKTKEDISLARSVAALAMYLVAKAHSARQKGGGEQ